MKRTQIQLPEPLYKQIKRLAESLDWSVAEVLRRGAEYMVRSYPQSNVEDWQPLTKHLGGFLAPIEDWRELANERKV